MNVIGLILFVACAIALFCLPRRWAPIPLLIGCCYITTGQGLIIGTFTLPVYRLLLLVAVIRIFLRGERLTTRLTAIDRIMVVWCGWTLFASIFQAQEPGSGTKYVAGALFSVIGAYYSMRCFCRDIDDVHRLIKSLCIILAPVSIAMLSELITHKNVFSIFGRVPEVPLLRGGKFRAQGPFSHPILAGTIGATAFPFVLAIWSRYRAAAIIGGAACVLMVFASTSSGPIMSLLFGLFALLMWRFRQYCRTLRVLAILGYVALLFVMERPPYYLIAKINLTGSSTGWHRALLIQRTFQHFDEWALVGTNQTRHWMPNQGSISPNHTDVTNYYIAFGLLGGFLCMLLMIVMVWKAFKFVGQYVRHPATSKDACFTVWCLGSVLFAHATSSISISYFGQTPVFFWLPIALIVSLYAALPPLRAGIAPTRAGRRFAGSQRPLTGSAGRLRAREFDAR